MKIMHQKGFTLIELLVTIAIFAIIASMAAPALGGMQARLQLNRDAQEFLGALNEARSFAVVSRNRVAVCPSKTTAGNITLQDCAELAFPSTLEPDASSEQLAEREQSINAIIAADRVRLIPISEQTAVLNTEATISIVFSPIGVAVPADRSFNFCNNEELRTITITQMGHATRTEGDC